MFKWRQGLRFTYLLNSTHPLSITNGAIHSSPFMQPIAESLTLAGRELKVFVKGCETPDSESEQLLQHSYHILNLRQSDGTVQTKKPKKNLIVSVKINKVTPSERSTVVYSLIMLCTETSIAWMKRQHYLPPLRTGLSSSPVPEHPI